MNIREFWNGLLAAAGSTATAANETDFYSKYLTALEGYRDDVDDLVVLGGTITGATANDTMTAVPDATAASTDTSAASLASVNTSIAAIENNFADLQAKVNAIINAMKQ
jgi:hypothetical protein